jgi:hypothetical protein
MTEGSVNLTISKEIVNPIVQAKIQEAILAALGGKEEVIQNVVKGILYDKVSHNGSKSSYSSDNKFNWIDIAVTQKIEQATKEAMGEFLNDCKPMIKAEIVKQLSSKKGIELFAANLLDQQKTIASNYHSKVVVQFEQK